MGGSGRVVARSASSPRGSARSAATGGDVADGGETPAGAFDDAATSRNRRRPPPGARARRPTRAPRWLHGAPTTRSAPPTPRLPALGIPMRVSPGATRAPPGSPTTAPTCASTPGVHTLRPLEPWACEADAPHQDRRHHRSRLARPGDARADDRGGHGRRAAELLARGTTRCTPRPRAASATPPSAPGGRWRSCRTCPGPSCASASCAEGTVELKAGDPVTFVCGADDTARRRDTDVRRLAGAGQRHRARRGAVPGRRRACGCAARRCARATASSTPTSRSAAAVATRQGLNIPGPANELPSVPEEDLEHLRAGLRDGRRHGRAVVRAQRRRTSESSASTRACR